MPHVVVRDLVKTYRIAERPPGLLGAVRGVLSRSYREVRALASVSFCVERGELLGFIGPNGAGKSTTIKILSGILQPTSGSVEVAGLSPFADRVRHVANIGVVFGQRTQLWWDLPVLEGLHLLREIYRVDAARFERSCEELVSVLGIGAVLAQPVRQLSLGQRMRVELAAALLHEPELLFLDEPTIGLDAPSKLAVRQVVQRLNRERGVTVILTESLEIANVLTYGGVQAAQYPLAVYARWFRRFLLWGVPFGAVAYLPVMTILGRADPLGFPAWSGAVSPLAGFVFLGGSFIAWRWGVRHYMSTGS